MRIFRSIAFQIWLPYATVFLVLLLGVSIYYPSRQQEVLLDQKKQELSEMARSIAVGIELSLDAGNFKGLEKTLRYFAGDRKEVSVLVLSESAAGGKQEVIAYFPPGANQQKLLAGAPELMEVNHPFVSSSFNGTVRVYLPMDILQKLLWSLNYPVFILLALAFLVTALLFYFVALRVSNPIAEITRYASSLIEDKAFQPVNSSSGNEIVILGNSLFSLKQSLDHQKERNAKLTEGLESEVISRTAELRQAIEKLNQAQVSARIGDFDYDRVSRTFNLSPILADILGFSKASGITLDQILELITPVAHGMVRPVFETARPDERKYSFDLRLKNAQKWLVMTAVCREMPGQAGVVVTGTLQDITDRKLAEAEVQKLSQVARLSTNGIIITDRFKRIVWANTSTEQLTGYSIAEMRGKTPSMFQCEETDRETLRLIKDGLDKLKPVRTEILNKSRTGRYYWLELHIQPFFDEFGNHEGFLAVEVDITERRKYEEDLRQSLQREKELSGMRSRFITMTSHEFRTPLTTIHSNLELMEFHINNRGLEQDERLKRYVGRISKEADRLTFLMNDILLLGRIDSGKLEFNPVPLQVQETVQEVIRSHEFIKNDERKIRLEVSGDPHAVRVDPVLFNHILFNLFSNALKYSPGAPEPVCTLKFNPQRLEMLVQDFGVGIPPADLPHIFESFHRGQNVSNFQGTGLGLQITRQFVEMHGGGISLESEEGKGTTVMVWLPLAQSA